MYKRATQCRGPHCVHIFYLVFPHVKIHCHAIMMQQSCDRSPTILHCDQNSNSSSPKQHLTIRMRQDSHTISNSLWHRGIASRHSLRAHHFKSIEKKPTRDLFWWNSNPFKFFQPQLKTRWDCKQTRIYSYTLYIYSGHRTQCVVWWFIVCSVLNLHSLRASWLRVSYGVATCIAGSLKWQVSFAEYRLFYRALLQKRPIILRSLLIVAILYLM